MNLFLTVSAALLCIGTVHKATCCSSCCCGEGWPIFDANLTSGKYFIAPESGLSWEKSLHNLQPVPLGQPVELVEGGPVLNELPVINQQSSSDCNLQGVLKIEFPRACNRMQKRRLQFDLYFDSTHSGWNFNIGDSTNNGYGGDAGHTSNAAEVHNINEGFRVYTNTLPGYTDYSTSGLLVEKFADALTNHITVTIGDECVMFDNNRGVQKSYRSEYLFTLSGQQTTYGAVDYTIYFAMNRVIYPFSSTGRTGTGLCRAVIRALDC